MSLVSLARESAQGAASQGQGPESHGDSHSCVSLGTETCQNQQTWSVADDKKTKVTDLGCVGVAIGAADHGGLCRRAGLALDQI